MSEPADAPKTPPASATGTPADAGLLGYASGGDFPAGAGTESEVFGEKGLLIARNGTTLPTRCILCGAESQESPVRLTFTWDSSFQRTKIQLSKLELRQKAHVFAYLCPPHRHIWSQGRRLGAMGTLVGASVLLAGIGLGVWSESSDVPSYTPLGITLTIGGFAVMTAAMFFFTLRSRTLSCRRIQEGYLYLDGAAEAFLAGLASLPPRRV